MVDETLEQRGQIYGRYGDGIEARAKVMNVLQAHHHSKNGCAMPQELELMLGDLVIKLVRAAASPNHTDNFHDIAGYAKLIEEYYSEDSK